MASTPNNSLEPTRTARQNGGGASRCCHDPYPRSRCRWVRESLTRVQPLWREDRGGPSPRAAQLGAVRPPKATCTPPL